MIEMTFAEYSRHIGVSRAAVSQAVGRGRLKECLERDADDKPIGIASVKLADQEWAGVRGLRAGAIAGAENPLVDGGGWSSSLPPGARTPVPDISHRVAPAAVPALATSVAIMEAARARKEIARAELAEQEVAKRRGEMISRAQAWRDVKDQNTLVQTKIRGVPTRIAQRFPDLAKTVVPVLEAFLNEALEELANGG